MRGDTLTRRRFIRNDLHFAASLAHRKTVIFTNSRFCKTCVLGTFGSVCTRYVAPFPESNDFFYHAGMYYSRYLRTEQK
jgi:hypothetical protein